MKCIGYAREARRGNGLGPCSDLEGISGRAPGARPHFDIGVDAPIEEFARVAPRHPAFRIVPMKAVSGV
jgi:hypothetical protein